MENLNIDHFYKFEGSELLAFTMGVDNQQRLSLVHDMSQDIPHPYVSAQDYTPQGVSLSSVWDGDVLLQEQDTWFK